MSTLKVAEKDKKGNQTGVIEDVFFFYTKIQTPSLKYQSKNEKEYTVDCVVDKATARKFKKAFPKNSCKDYENDDFLEKFNVEEVPFPKQEEQFVVKLKADSQIKKDVTVNGEKLKKGDEVPYSWGTRPKVFVPAGTEGKVKDITMESLVGNGSQGTVAFKVLTNDYGTFPQLTGILVTELVEYEGSGGSGSPFGEVEGGLNQPDERPADEDPDEEDMDEDDVEDDDNPFDVEDDD